MKVTGIAEKYTSHLRSNKKFGAVWYSDAEAAVIQAVEEAVVVAKKEIESAIGHLQNRIAKQDEFISAQQMTNKALEEQNNGLKSVNSKLQKNFEEQKQRYTSENEQLQEENNSLTSQLEFKEDFIQNLNKENDGLKDDVASWRETARQAQQTLELYREMAKEAYRQGITPEIRKQKVGIAGILESLIRHKQKPAAVQLNEHAVSTKPVSKAETTETPKKPVPDISEELIERIKLERQKQVLDRERMEKASTLIRRILEDAPDQKEYFKNIMKRYIPYGDFKHYTEKEGFSTSKIYTDESGKVVKKETGYTVGDRFVPTNYKIPSENRTSIEIQDVSSYPFICFIDENGKKLLRIGFSDHYFASIYDKAGRPMVNTGIEGGVIKYLSAYFNDIKQFSEIESDVRMNYLTQKLIKNAKRGTVRKSKYEFTENTDYKYLNKDGVAIVDESLVTVDNNESRLYTYINNPQNQKNKAFICQNFNPGEMTVCVNVHMYVPRGTTEFQKMDNNGKQSFGISVYRAEENEHWEVQSLIDKNAEDKKSIPPKRIFEKTNYGTVHHPLTQSFTFYDLSELKIKPWDLGGILGPYIK